MSLHPSSSAFTMRHPGRHAERSASADPQLLAAVALLVFVLIADVLIPAAAPGLADLASLYVSTT